MTRIPAEFICRLPGVLRVSQDRDALDIQVAQAEPVLRELLQRDAELSEIEVTSAGLEDAFLALTQDNNSTTEAPRR